MKPRKDKIWTQYGMPFVASFALVSIFLIGTAVLKKAPTKPAISIILSPHFDDAVLSLGGFMAETKTPIIVATFFTKNPEIKVIGTWDTTSGFADSSEAVPSRSKENVLALKRTGAHEINFNHLDHQYKSDQENSSKEKNEQAIEKDIQTIIKTFSSSYSLTIYGPAEFGNLITHPDHALLHRAFTKIATESEKKDSTKFFYYEDFPYIREYVTGTSTPLVKFLSSKYPSIFFDEDHLLMSARSLEMKAEAIKDYTSQVRAFETLGENLPEESKIFTTKRCEAKSPAYAGCEVVYKIIKKN